VKSCGTLAITTITTGQFPVSRVDVPAPRAPDAMGYTFGEVLEVGANGDV
jgi:hypothetical protein